MTGRRNFSFWHFICLKLYAFSKERKNIFTSKNSEKIEVGKLQLHFLKFRRMNMPLIRSICSQRSQNPSRPNIRKLRFQKILPQKANYTIFINNPFGNSIRHRYTLQSALCRLKIRVWLCNSTRLLPTGAYFATWIKFIQTILLNWFFDYMSVDAFHKNLKNICATQLSNPTKPYLYLRWLFWTYAHCTGITKYMGLVWCVWMNKTTLQITYSANINQCD